jgi:hypothetical protein
MDKLYLAGQNLGQVFSSRYEGTFISTAVTLKTKTAQLKVEATFRISPDSFLALRVFKNHPV